MLKFSEREIVEGLKKGNMSSFRILFDEKYAQFYAFINGLVKNSWIAEDITQNVFMKVWINKEKLNPGQSLHNYLYVLAKNEVRDHFRLKANSAHQQLQGQDKIFVEDFDGTIDAKMMKEQVAEIVSKMPEQRRLVFSLSREKLLSNKQIARELNLSVRTVERHILLALKDIRSGLPVFFLFLYLGLFK